MEYEAVLKVAVAAARDATAVHRAGLGRVGQEEWAEKGLHDFVSRVDREAEARILERIQQSFPDHRFLAEEEATADPPQAGPMTGSTDAASARLAAAKQLPGWFWVIDPLDGTTNFLHGYPMYSASVAALHDGRLAVAAVVHGVTGEAWTAVRGGGAFLNGRRIHVSSTERLGNALIGTGFPFRALELLPSYLVQFDQVVRHAAGVRRAGSAALDLCHVASGYFDGFWELSLAPWDVAAGALIVREAGGLVTRVEGNDDGDVLGAGSLLAGNPAIHTILAGMLNQTNS
jgi:myo-inositol-1(or 4)-monophosphatase